MGPERLPVRRNKSYHTRYAQNIYSIHSGLLAIKTSIEHEPIRQEKLNIQLQLHCMFPDRTIYITQPLQQGEHITFIQYKFQTFHSPTSS